MQQINIQTNTLTQMISTSAITEFLKFGEYINIYNKNLRREQLEIVATSIARGSDTVEKYLQSSVKAITLYYDQQPTNFVRTIMDYRFVCFCADLADES